MVIHLTIPESSSRRRPICSQLTGLFSFRTRSSQELVGILRHLARSCKENKEHLDLYFFDWVRPKDRRANAFFSAITGYKDIAQKGITCDPTKYANDPYPALVCSRLPNLNMFAA